MVVDYERGDAGEGPEFAATAEPRQQRLCFLPEPHGHGALRGTRDPTKGAPMASAGGDSAADT